MFFHRYTPPPRRELSSNRKALWIKFGLACHAGTLALNLFRISSRLIPSGIFHSTISVIMIVAPVTRQKHTSASRGKSLPPVPTGGVHDVHLSNWRRTGALTTLTACPLCLQERPNFWHRRETTQCAITGCEQPQQIPSY